MKKELISMLLITIIITSILDGSLNVGPLGIKLSTGNSHGKSEVNNAQTLRNENVGSGKLSGLDFWWANTSGERPFSNLQDPLLAWNSDDASKFSDLAYVEGNNTRLIVGVDNEKDPSFTQVGELVARYDGRIADAIRIGQQVEALVIELPLSSAKTFAVNAYSLWSVRYVEPNMKIQTQFAPNDANWGLQWGPQKIQVDWAWNTTKGSSKILVAVIDTGIDYTHPDIAPNYVPGGFDWANNDTDPMDDNGHGTHCAGIIGAVINNSIGIAGIAQVLVMAEKVLSAVGNGYWDRLAKGIINATDCGAKIISMSLGGYFDSELVHDALRYAYSAGVLIVAAAGNGNTSDKFYPAGYDEVVAVVATDQYDNKALFSNWGEWIELAAPGVDIYSTVPYSIVASGYENLSGTSMACPHVTGVAALAWSEYQNKSRDWIRMWLRYTADDLGVPGFDYNYGYGRVNARKAVEETMPNHDIALVNLVKPIYSEPGRSQYINATVMNFGTTDENNLEIRFIVNGSLTETRQVSFLANGTSTKVSFQWTPATLGEYNITIYAEPVTGEDITTDNVMPGWISVRYPLISPIPGQWAAYTVATHHASTPLLSYMNITFDYYVKPYVIHVTERILDGYGNVSVYTMTVNTWDRRIQGNVSLPRDYGMSWFYGLIETSITIGSTVNLVDGTATVDESKYILLGVYPIDCWKLVYYDFMRHENDFYYDRASGLLIARNYSMHGGYVFEWRLNSTNIMLPSYEHELAVAFDAPLYWARGNSTLLNATVFNIGLSTESNVVLLLTVGGSEAKRVTIPTLQNGTSFTASYLWTPTLEATYSWSASVEPVVNETYMGNNVMTRSVTVSHPLINPVQGQYANYSLSFAMGPLPSSTWNFTYLRYISRYYRINVFVSSLDDRGYVHNRWVVVNTFTRIVEDDSDSYWKGSLFLGWIETNVTLGSTVRIWSYEGKVVGNKAIFAVGRFIDCWEIQVDATYTGPYNPLLPEPYRATFWYDKASGILIGRLEVESQSPFTPTVGMILLETNIPFGFGPSGTTSIPMSLALALMIIPTVIMLVVVAVASIRDVRAKGLDARRRTLLSRRGRIRVKKRRSPPEYRKKTRNSG